MADSCESRTQTCSIRAPSYTISLKAPKICYLRTWIGCWEVCLHSMSNLRFESVYPPFTTVRTVLIAMHRLPLLDSQRSLFSLPAGLTRVDSSPPVV